MLYIFGQVVLFAVMIAPTPQPKSMPNKAKSENEYVLSIQSLTARAKELNDSLAAWSRWNTIFVGITVFAAFGLFVTQRTSNNKSGVLVRVQGELDEAKESLAGLRIAELQNGNLQLQSQLDANSGNVAKLQTAASDAKKAQQQVEIELEKQRQKTLELAKRQAARFIPKDALSSRLKGKATGTVTILYQPNDPEAYWFAFSLMGELSNGGWKVPSLPEPIPATMTPRTPGFSDEDMQRIAAFEQRFPAAMRVGVGSGLTILAISIQGDQPADGAYRELTDALSSLRLLNGRRMDINLPPNNFILVVGPKP